MREYTLLLLLILVCSCKKQEELPVVDVLGHAGTSLHKERTIFPANSFESIQYAVDVLAADGVEVDVQMTKDSVLVVYHDPYLEESSNFFGCMSEYNYEEVKSLKLENSKYTLANLNDVLLFLQSRKKLVYLDIKDFQYCKGTQVSTSAFQYALNQSLDGVTNDYKSLITLGMLNLELLKSINFPSKCFEHDNVNFTIQSAVDNNFGAILFHTNRITDVESKLLLESGLYWGIFGIKDKWSIKSAINLKPNFVITDNIAYTKQISN